MGGAKVADYNDQVWGQPPPTNPIGANGRPQRWNPLTQAFEDDTQPVAGGTRVADGAASVPGVRESGDGQASGQREAVDWSAAPAPAPAPAAPAAGGAAGTPTGSFTAGAVSPERAASIGWGATGANPASNPYAGPQASVTPSANPYETAQATIPRLTPPSFAVPYVGPTSDNAALYRREQRNLAPLRQEEAYRRGLLNQQRADESYWLDQNVFMPRREQAYQRGEADYWYQHNVLRPRAEEAYRRGEEAYWYQMNVQRPRGEEAYWYDQQVSRPRSERSWAYSEESRRRQADAWAEYDRKRAEQLEAARRAPVASGGSDPRVQ